MPSITGLRPHPSLQERPSASTDATLAAGRVATTEHTAPAPTLPPRPVEQPRVTGRGFLERALGPAIERTLDAVANTLDRLTASGVHAPQPSLEDRTKLANRQAGLEELLGTPTARVGGGESGAPR